MGWTQDHRDRDFRGFNDAVHDRRPAGRALAQRAQRPDRGGTEGPGASGSGMGIPRILRRRARWVGARLRHVRGEG
jgi:hypothetical protein